MAKVSSYTPVTAVQDGDKFYLAVDDGASGFLDRTLDGDTAKRQFGAAGNATTTDPGVGDDSADGYRAGSLWLNTTDGGLFVCEDASAGAAVWTELGSGGGGSASYDMLLGFVGSPTANALDWILVGASCTIASSDPGEAYARTNPSDGAWTATIRKNGTSVGTVSISTAGAVTWTVGSDVSLAAGDRIEIVAPDPADSTAADLQVLLRGA